MNKLPIYLDDSSDTDSAPIFDGDLLHTEKGLVFKLAAIGVLEKLGLEKNDKTLDEICTAVSLGTPVASKHCLIIEEKEVLVFPR